MAKSFYCYETLQGEENHGHPVIQLGSEDGRF